MTELDLFDELTFIDDDLILEVQETPDQKPIRFRGLRKAAVLAAAVMMLVVSVMASGGDFSILRPSGWVNGTGATSYDMDNEKQMVIVNDQGIYNPCKGYSNIPTFTVGKLHAAGIWTETNCSGHQLQVIHEAILLMPDGQTQYKAQITEGADAVIATMDNVVDGVAGEIMHVRCTVSILTETDEDLGARAVPASDGKSWVLLQNWNVFLPTQLSTPYPKNVDFRFPDTQKNYDGRAE